MNCSSVLVSNHFPKMGKKVILKAGQEESFSSTWYNDMCTYSLQHVTLKDLTVN